MATKLHALADVIEITTLSKSTIYRFIRLGKFPAPKRISKGRVVWRDDVISEWVDSNTNA